METVNRPIDQWLNDGTRSSISTLSLGNRDNWTASSAFITQHVLDLAKSIPVANDTSGSTLSSIDQVTEHGSSRQSTSYSTLSSTSQSAQSLFSEPAATLATVATELTTEDENRGPYLRCDFSVAGCRIGFPVTQFDLWCRHSLSHFGDLSPPPKCVCQFCPEEFENIQNPLESWTRRMIHCCNHLLTEGHINPQPDFWLIQYVGDNRLITDHDREQATRYTQRPHVAGLVSRSSMTGDATAQDDRSTRQLHDLRKEDRERKRQTQNKGKEQMRSNAGCVGNISKI